MSKIDELIERLCPEGVEYKKLGEVCEIKRGTVYSKKYISEHSGSYPLYSSQTMNNGELGRISTYDYEGDYLTWTTDGAYAGTIFHRKGRFSITNVCGIIQINPVILNIRFLYHWLSIVAKDYVYAGMGNPKLMSNQMEKVTIPLPPLPVQQEIVRILDAFTQLEAELEAELEARKKQYEYYRDTLLSFEHDDPEVEWKRLGEVCETLRTGLNPRRFFALNTANADNYYVTIKELRKHRIVFNENTNRIDEAALKLCNNRSNLERGDVLFSGTGTIGEVALLEETPTNWNIKEGIYSLKPKEKDIKPKYLMYILEAGDIKSRYMALAEGGTVKSVSMQKLKQISIPLPPLPVQQEIVRILDKFEALTSDLQSGLPAEIEARRKQYEYYRDRLLTFKVKN